MNAIKTAHCWTGAPVFCPKCKGPTRDLDDEYNGLSGGGDYERFECLDKSCKQPTIYVEMPD